ncbi:hypothetical protein HaLaN_30970, partial [Haematococcus lacustris]
MAPALGKYVMQGKTYVEGTFERSRLKSRKVVFIPMEGRLIAVYPRQDIFVIFCPRGEGLTTDEESNLVEFLNAHVKQTEWEVIDGTCPLQKDDWSDELRLLINMEYLWRRSFRRNVQTGIRYDANRMLARQRLLQCTLETEGEWCSLIDVHPKWKNRAPSDMADPLSDSEVPSPVPSPPMSIVSPESPPSPSPPPSHDPGHTPPQSSGRDNGTESQASPGPLPLPS